MATEMSSSSDSEDDEEKEKLAQALDPDFLKGTFNGNGAGGRGNLTKQHVSVTEDLPVSKRSKIFDKGGEDSEFPKPYSLDVTPDCQKFIAKQLGKSLDKSLKEVSKQKIDTEYETTEAETLGIKLFASSQLILTENDLKPTPHLQKRNKPNNRKKKKKSKKTKAASDDDSSSSDSEEEDKLKAVAVTADWVINSV